MPTAPLQFNAPTSAKTADIVLDANLSFLPDRHGSPHDPARLVAPTPGLFASYNFRLARLSAYNVVSREDVQRGLPKRGLAIRRTKRSQVPY